jgi:hypothetical protein
LTIAHSKIRKIPIAVPAATAANEYCNALLQKLHNEKDRKQQQKSPPSQSSATAIRQIDKCSAKRRSDPHPGKLSLA